VLLLDTLLYKVVEMKVKSKLILLFTLFFMIVKSTESDVLIGSNYNNLVSLNTSSGDVTEIEFDSGTCDGDGVEMTYYDDIKSNYYEVTVGQYIKYGHIFVYFNVKFINLKNTSCSQYPWDTYGTSFQPFGVCYDNVHDMIWIGGTDEEMRFLGIDANTGIMLVNQTYNTPNNTGLSKDFNELELYDSVDHGAYLMLDGNNLVFLDFLSWETKTIPEYQLALSSIGLESTLFNGREFDYKRKLIIQSVIDYDQKFIQIISFDLLTNKLNNTKFSLNVNATSYSDYPQTSINIDNTIYYRIVCGVSNLYFLISFDYMKMDNINVIPINYDSKDVSLLGFRYIR